MRESCTIFRDDYDDMICKEQLQHSSHGTHHFAPPQITHTHEIETHIHTPCSSLELHTRGPSPLLILTPPSDSAPPLSRQAAILNREKDDHVRLICTFLPANIPLFLTLLGIGNVIRYRRRGQPPLCSTRTYYRCEVAL